MMEWIAANAATLVISAILLVVVVFAARHVYKVRKSGGCSGCADGGRGCSSGSQGSCCGSDSGAAGIK